MFLLILSALLFTSAASGALPEPSDSADGGIPESAGKTPAVKTAVIGGKTHNLAFARTITLANGETQGVYLSEDGAEVIFNGEGNRISGMFLVSGEGSASARKADGPDARKAIAEDFLKPYADTAGYNFLGETYTSDTGVYTLRYARFIGGLRTSDFIFATMNRSGRILEFGAPNAGIFDGVEIPGIDMEKCDGEADRVLREMYGEGLLEYSVDLKILDISASGELVLNYTVKAARQILGEVYSEFITLPIKLG